MAKIVSLIQYVGKAGNTVGQKGPKGGIVFKQLAASVANPRTDAQMRQRAKMKLAAQVAGMLGEVGRTALIANGFRKTDRGTLIKRLLQNVVVNQNGSQASLLYDLHLVDNPSYAEAITMQITSDSSQFTATFSGAAEGEPIAKCIMVHDLNTGLWRHTTRPLIPRPERTRATVYRDIYPQGQDWGTVGVSENVSSPRRRTPGEPSARRAPTRQASCSTSTA